MVGGDHLDVVGAQRLPHVVLVSLFPGPQRGGTHPFGPFERAPFLAPGAELLFQREVQVLRTGLAEDVLAVVASGGNLRHSLLGTHVHDIERSTGEIRQHDGAVGGLLLRLPRARRSMKIRRGVTGGDGLLHKQVDDAAVLGVHHDHRAVGRGLLHRLGDLAIIREKNTFVGHKELEARHALGQQLIHCDQRGVLHIAEDLVKPVVDRALPGGLRLPPVVLVDHVLARVLHHEVNNGCRAAPGRRSRSGLESIRRVSTTEWHLHVGVSVDAAGDHVLAGRIDHRVDIGGHVEAEQERSGGEHGRDGLAVDEHVGERGTGRVDDRAVGDEGLHGGVPTASGCSCTTRDDGRGRTASCRAPAGSCPSRDRGSRSLRVHRCHTHR